MLWLAIQFPQLPVEIHARGSALPGPLVIADSARPDAKSVFLNQTAAAEGLQPGMKISSAIARVEGLRIQVHDAQREQEALQALAAWAGQFTSHVSLEAPRTLLLEVQGSLRCFGGLDALCGQIEQALTELGHEYCLALAATPLGAVWLARAGKPLRLSSSHALVGQLRQLSLACTGLSESRLATLRGMGLRSVGDVLRLPRSGLTKRLGKEWINNLDKAMGQQPDPREAFEPEPRFEHRLALPGVATAGEALLFAARRLLLELQGVLRSRCAGAQQMRWRFLHRNEQPTEFWIGLVTPGRDPEHLLLLLRERLDQLTLPAPVEEMELLVERMPALPETSDSLFPHLEPQTTQTRGHLVEQLSARLGRDAVRGLHVVAEHRPEYQWRHSEQLTAKAERVQEMAPLTVQRPLWLLDEPVPLQVVNNKPFMQGPLQCEQGRERIESGWWDGGDVARDYFVARNPRGVRLWIYRSLRDARRWFMHGIFG